MKHILSVLLFFPFCAYALEPHLDVSLGSFVNLDNRTGQEGNLPFWGDVYLEQNVTGSVSVIGGAGHESGADRNGDEFDGEYSLVGAKVKRGLLFSKIQVRKFFHGDLSAGDTVFDLELGVEQNGFRFTGFRSQSESDRYDTMGLKFGKTF